MDGKSRHCQLVTVVTIVPDDCNCPNENCPRGRNRQYNVHTRTFTTSHTSKEQNKNTIFLTVHKHLFLWPSSVKFLHGNQEWMMFVYNILCYLTNYHHLLDLRLCYGTHGKLSTSSQWQITEPLTVYFEGNETQAGIATCHHHQLLPSCDESSS